MADLYPLIEPYDAGITLSTQIPINVFMEHSRVVSWWLQLYEVKAERAYGDECCTDQLGNLEYA
jgi:hypothetical protein